MKRAKISSLEMAAILNARRRALTEPEEEEEEEDIFERRTWTIAYDSKDLVGASWPASELSTVDTTGCTLAAASSNATTDVSTSGLTTSGIGASRVDKAVQASSETTNFYSATNIPPSFATNGDFSVRHVFRSGWTTGTEVVWFFGSGSSTALMRARQSAAASITLTYTNLFTPNFTGHSNDQWYIVDIIVLRTGGSGGNARVTYYRNGVNVGSQDDDGDASMIAMNGTADPQFLQQPGQHFVFWGLRAGTVTSLEDHQADAQALGLYTP
jgi:hypothetical protein